jgi:hypothetical protein
MRRQFLGRDLDQDRWKPWSVSNRLKNAKSELAFLRPLGAVESFLLEWQTCLVCSPLEPSAVGNFDKAIQLDVHALCWKWCWNVTEPVARYRLCSRGGHVPESRGNCSVQAEMLFDCADALKRVVDLLPAGCISCNVLT